LLGLTFAEITSAQLARTAKPSGPRALGLLELAPDGKVRLIPIAIMVDGKFYDASAYKASPVPLAIWSGTVYEAESNGVSQGLFTVGGAIKAGTNWFADGKWQPAGSAPVKPRHTEAKPVLDNDEGPPKLRRLEAEKSQPPAAPQEAKAPPASDTGSSTSAPSAKPAPAAPEEVASTSSGIANDTDPNRPVLQRGKTRTLGSTQPPAQGLAVSKGGATTPAAKTADKKTTQLIPAISDAGGPEPRPYAYDIKPDEDEKYRKKMLALAREVVQARAKLIAPGPADTTPATRPSTSTRSAAKSAPPSFADLQFRAFDLWNTNEPVFVLIAKAQMPNRVAKNADSASDVTYFVTLVAKADMYGDLRKLHTGVTDNHHLDEIPRLELIDAVDADGDGRGEFLFRQVSDTGSAWGVYRAGADQLFPLFQGTPSGQ